ncbi:MAG TPA: hypothetical protein VH025_06810 [Solirubrobacteraceae bacterium]|jgi:hypothetical protein|nr:hypothetical protein [Solirubrobacteraceae bacterium]
MNQLLQIVGAVLILVPFGYQQLGSLEPDSPTYLWPNVLGSGVLAGVALSGSNWGFLMLEGCWALVSVRGLLSAYRQTAP